MPAPPSLVEPIVNGVTPGHNTKHHSALARRFDSTVANVREWGGDHTGVVDASSVVQEMYNLGLRDIHFPRGRFKLTLDSVAFGTDVIVSGPGVIFTTQTTAGAFFTFPAGSKDFVVAGPTFESPNDRAVAVKVLSAAGQISSNFEVSFNHCINTRLVITNDDTITYANHSTNTVSGTVTRDVKIVGNTGKRTGANLTNKAFILLWYTIGGEVHDNRIDGYGYGIQWWGGDANPVDGNGALANERKCGKFSITGNLVERIHDALGGGGGIWGSMGFGITVGDNVVDDCGDVGIDFEGCIDCTASGNVVSNAVNGNLTSFFYNRSVRFTGNTCSHNVTGRIMARVQNNYPTSDNKDISIDTNTFYCPTGVISRIALETSQRSILRNNTCTNVYISGEVNNVRNSTIKDNDLLFDTALGTDPGRSAQADAIHVGRNHLGALVVITGNTIESLVAQPATANAISSYQDDSTRDVLEFIDDNICRGWTTPIATVWNGANAGFVARTFIRRNTIDVGATISTTNGPSAATPATIVKEGNRYANGTAVP